MAGRGRGAARGVSFAVEGLGFGRGDALPTAVLQPPALYPPLDFKPCPVLDIEGSAEDYVYQLCKEFKGSMRESSYFLRSADKKKDVQRYSDKYQLSNQRWKPDLAIFPRELWPIARRKKKLVSSVKPNVGRRSELFKSSTMSGADTSLPLPDDFDKDVASGEEDEQEQEPGVKKEKTGEDAKPEESEEEELDEEDMEEDNDYITNYFDNGENYGMEEEDDNADEGATY